MSSSLLRRRMIGEWLHPVTLLFTMSVFLFLFVYRILALLATAPSPNKPGMFDSAMSYFRGWNRELAWEDWHPCLIFWRWMSRQRGHGVCHGTAWFWVNSVYGKAALDFWWFLKGAEIIGAPLYLIYGVHVIYMLLFFVWIYVWIFIFNFLLFAHIHE